MHLFGTFTVILKLNDFSFNYFSCVRLQKMIFFSIYAIRSLLAFSFLFHSWSTGLVDCRLLSDGVAEYIIWNSELILNLVSKVILEKVIYKKCEPGRKSKSPQIADYSPSKAAPRNNLSKEIASRQAIKSCPDKTTASAGVLPFNPYHILVFIQTLLLVMYFEVHQIKFNETVLKEK